MRDADQPPRRFSGQTLFLIAAAAVSAATVGAIVLWPGHGPDNHAEGADSGLTLQDIPFNGPRAYDYLKKLCAIGPRPSGSPGMTAQQTLLAEHFKKCGGQVEFQRFRIPDPRRPAGPPAVSIANIIVRWHPKATKRILLAAHYDTLPYPLEDRNPWGRFVGANDNASGVAILMELAHEMPKLELNYGVDFVLLDAEEYMYQKDGQFFIGSEYFARQYAGSRLPYRYHWGVLLDMVGGKNLQLYQEGHGLAWRDTRPLVESIWATANRLGVREFIAKGKHTIRDDHVTLHDIGGIPCIDIIDAPPDYPPWHTQADTPEACSALSLAKVGWVLREWLKSVP
jgi:glutaminyl-peptide cyclotransferase